MNKKTIDELNKISPTFREYFDAKRIVDEYEKQPKYDKKFYVQLIDDFYAVGTFAGWSEDGYFTLKVEDTEPIDHVKDSHFIITPLKYVYEKKQKDMIRLHCGIE